MSNTLFDNFGEFITAVVDVFNDAKNNTSLKTFKSETYKDGQLVNKIEKVWENGKLVKDEGETHQVENKNKCKNECKKDQPKCVGEKYDCKCNDESYRKLEEKYCDKLQLIEKEIDGLNDKLQESLNLNDRLVRENEVLKKKLSVATNRYQELESKFEGIRKFIL